MSKLQELLDARWPLSDKLNESDNLDYKMQRSAFSCGYNAAKEEYAKPTENLNINMEDLLNKCAAMIKTGHKADAIMTYKKATGASITEAANILGIQNINNG